MSDFDPADHPYDVELQNLVAVLECTSKEMIPSKFQKLSRTEILNNINEIKALIGER